jgi:hypothetical protein
MGQTGPAVRAGALRIIAQVLAVEVRPTPAGHSETARCA